MLPAQQNFTFYINSYAASTSYGTASLLTIHISQRCSRHVCNLEAGPASATKYNDRNFGLLGILFRVRFLFPLQLLRMDEVSVFFQSLDRLGGGWAVFCSYHLCRAEPCRALPRELSSPSIDPVSKLSRNNRGRMNSLKLASPPYGMSSTPRECYLQTVHHVVFLLI